MVELELLLKHWDSSGAYELAYNILKKEKHLERDFKHQAIAFKLADMATEIEAARLLCIKSAWLKDKVRIMIKLEQWQKYLLQKAAMRTTVEAVKYMVVMAL